MSAPAQTWDYFDLTSEQEIFQLRGGDVPGFLNKYLTQDVLRLSTPGAALGAFLTQKGKIVSDALVLKWPDRVLLLFSKGYGARVQQHLRIFLGLEDVTMEPSAEEFSHLILLGDSIPAELRRDALGEISYQGLKGWAWGTDRFGAPGVEMLLSKSTPWQSVFSQAGGTPLPVEQLEALRIQAGLPKMGIDMGEENLVAEVGLDKRATSFNKGCYLGQETTARVNTQGHVNRQLTRLRLEKPIEGTLPLEVFQGQRSVGHLSSAITDPRGHGTLALGLIQTKALSSADPMILANGQVVSVVGTTTAKNI